MDKQIDVDERVSRRDARKSTHGVLSTHADTALKLASDRAIVAFSPPRPSTQRSASNTSSTHNIEGVLMVEPRKIPSFNLPPLVRRKILGSGHEGTYDSSRSTARGDSASMP